MIVFEPETGLGMGMVKEEVEGLGMGRVLRRSL